jgi:hypothetical protein
VRGLAVSCPDYPFVVGHRSAVRACAVIAAAALMAAVVVLAFAEPPARVAPSSGGDAAAISPTADAAILKAAVRLRPAQVMQRQEVDSKGRALTLVATLVGFLLAGVGLVRFLGTVPPARPCLARRSGSLRLRAPPFHLA